MFTVAIIGRPNVGKSTLFNRVLGRRQAIVKDFPGVTRDRHYAESEYRGRRFQLVDTGGLVPSADEQMFSLIREQSRRAIAEADALIFLMDGREGLTPLDQEIADLLRGVKKPVFVAINKIDTPKSDPLISDFYVLGMAPLYPLSAEHGTGVAELLDALYPLLPAATEGAATEEIPKVAVVGRPNVGKSTFINTLLGGPGLRAPGEQVGPARRRPGRQGEVRGRAAPPLRLPHVGIGALRLSPRVQDRCGSLSGHQPGPQGLRAPRADGAAQSDLPGRDRGESFADPQGEARQIGIYHPGRRQTAHVRPLLQASGGGRIALLAVSRELSAGAVRLRRHPDPHLRESQMRRLRALVPFVLLFGLLGSFIAGAAAPSAPVEIVASKRAFTPETLTLPQGEPATLVIRNDDEDLHSFVPLLLLQRTNVQVSGNGAPEFNETGFVRVLIPPHGRVELRFTPKAAGTFHYICDLPGHSMRAQIVVK